MNDCGDVVDLLVSKDAVSILRSMIGRRVKFAAFDGYVPARCWTGEVPLEIIGKGIGIEHWAPRRGKPQRDEVTFAYVAAQKLRGSLRDTSLQRLAVYPRFPIGLKAMAYRERRSERGVFLDGPVGVQLGAGVETLVRVDIFDVDMPADKEEGTPAVYGDEGIGFSFSGGYRLNLWIGVIGVRQVVLTPGNAADETFRGREPRLSLS